MDQENGLIENLQLLKYVSKLLQLIFINLILAVIQNFSVTKFIPTAVVAEWSRVLEASHYTVYYESTSSSSRKKRQVETGMRVFPGDTTEGLIGGLDPNLNYLFSISTSFIVNGMITEGERTQPVHLPSGFVVFFLNLHDRQAKMCSIGVKLHNICLSVMLFNISIVIQYI